MNSLICFFALFIASCTAQAIAGQRSPKCQNANGFVPVDGSCDAYVECRDYQAKNLQCPDGLYFDTDAQWPNYPCGYPEDVSCIGRSVIQPANANEECPHQYGFYESPLATPTDCGRYRMCVEGQAVEMYCPPGLAYNREIARCDWLENVPSCQSEGYLGFQCPPAALDGSGNPVVTNHKYKGDCFSFVSCMSGNARLLSCDSGLAFDENQGRCEIVEKVACDQPTRKQFGVSQQ